VITCKFHRAFSILKDIDSFTFSSLNRPTATFANSHLIVDFSTSSQHPLVWTTALTYCIPATVYGLFLHGKRLFWNGCGFTFHGVVLGTTSYNSSVRQFTLNLSIQDTVSFMAIVISPPLFPRHPCREAIPLHMVCQDLYSVFKVLSFGTILLYQTFLDLSRDFLKNFSW